MLPPTASHLRVKPAAPLPPARSGQPDCLLIDAWERLRLLASYNQVGSPLCMCAAHCA